MISSYFVLCKNAHLYGKYLIPFSQKHCTLYLYSNGHVWIPIYEFEICASVKKHANRTPTFGNCSGIQQILRNAVQVSPLD